MNSLRSPEYVQRPTKPESGCVCESSARPAAVIDMRQIRRDKLHSLCTLRKTLEVDIKRTIAILLTQVRDPVSQPGNERCERRVFSAFEFRGSDELQSHLVRSHRIK